MADYKENLHNNANPSTYKMLIILTSKNLGRSNRLVTES